MAITPDEQGRGDNDDQEIQGTRGGESDKKLRVLRTDRGDEFTSVEFTAYYADQGVVRLHTALYLPQQNGVVEQRNQMMVDMARSMKKAKSMPIDRISSTVIENKKSIETHELDRFRPSV